MLQHNRDVWNERVNEAMDFVLNQYAARREHWPSSFREKLRRMANEYQDFSTYVTVKTIDYHTQEASVLGTLRLIKERDGRLPMESYLGVSIRSRGAVKYEPGNFSIEKSVNGYVFGEILLHLIETILEKSKTQESHFYTYADRQSLMMYKMLGFTPVERGDLTIDPGVQVDDRGRIEKDGVWWTALQVSRMDLQKLLDNFLSGHVKAQDNMELREALKGRHQEIENRTHFTDRIFTGLRRTNNDPQIYECSMYLRSEAGKDGGPERINFLFARGGMSQHFRGWTDFTIPAEPLKEGFHSERFLSADERQTLTYHQGILTFREEIRQGDSWPEFEEYKIKISPDLDVIEYLHTESSQGFVLDAAF